MNFSLSLSFKKLYFLPLGLVNLGLLFIPKSGFPHALKHGGVPNPYFQSLFVEKVVNPAGTFKGFT